MMNAILCLGHFCEVHGPTSIMCTQALDSRQARAEIKAAALPSAGCAACQLTLPDVDASTPPCLQTLVDVEGQTMHCVSTHSPASQARFTAVRQTCLRMLSSEHTFNDATPMLFSDSSIGSAMVLVFQVADDSSRGHSRRYGLTCVCEDETTLVQAWPLLAPQLEAVAKSLQKRALQQTRRQAASGLGPDRYLRTRDFKQPAKSLPAIVGCKPIFIELHSRFTKMLADLQR